MRTAGVPSLDLWEILPGRSVTLGSHEDKETCISAMPCGDSAAMRHLRQTHGVCLRWLAERFQEKHYKLYYERSALQAADIYTKAFTMLAEWIRACKLINHLDPARFWGGRDSGAATNDKEWMSSEHKRGVGYDYWVSNPWHGQDSRSLRLTLRSRRS